jgi:L-amino acid N-acyltransferase YncA
MLIRDAEMRDLPQIVGIVNAFLLTTTIEWTEQPYTLSDRERWLGDHRRADEPVLVAESAGEIMGFANYGDFRDAKKWPGYRFVVEHTLHVREQYWHAGVGRLLLDSLAQRAIAAGKQVMVGAIDGENQASLLFHERCGFVEVGRMPGVGFKHERWLTLVLMQRRLVPQE